MHAEREIFLAQGFICYPKFFARSEITKASLDGTKAVDIVRKLESTQFVHGAKFVKPIDTGSPEVCLRVEWIKHLFKGISELTGHKRLSNLMQILCDQKKSDEIICQLNYRIPWDETSYAIHRDLQLDKGVFSSEKDIHHSALVSIGLGEADENSAPLVLFPGSHKGDYDRDAKSLSLDEGLLMPLGPGDIVVFHPALLHGSGPNHTSSYRFLALSLFVPKNSYQRVSPDFSI